MKVYIDNKECSYNDLSNLIDILYTKGYIKKLEDKYYAKVGEGSNLRYVRDDKKILEDIEVLTNGKVKVEYEETKG